MNEAEFWSRRLRPLILRECAILGWKQHIERIENTVGDGSPDVDYCIDGAPGKIELKFAEHHPVRTTSQVLGKGCGLRRSQIIWATRRLNAGGRVFLAIGTPAATWVIDLRGYSPQDMIDLSVASVATLSRLADWMGLSGDAAKQGYLPPYLIR